VGNVSLDSEGGEAEPVSTSQSVSEVEGGEEFKTTDSLPEGQEYGRHPLDQALTLFLQNLLAKTREYLLDRLPSA